MDMIRTWLYNKTLMILLMLIFIGCTSNNDSTKRDDDTKIRLGSNRESNLSATDSGLDSIQDLTNADLDVVDTILIGEFLRSTKIKSIPYYDSTNIDDFLEGASIPDNLFSALNLDTIIPYNLKNLDKVWILNRLDISRDFYAITVGFMPNEHELFTTLVTFDNQFNMISFRHIAYDEIAESCNRVESFIDVDYIKVIDKDFCYKMTTDTSKFLIQKDGEIIANH